MFLSVKVFTEIDRIIKTLTFTSHQEIIIVVRFSEELILSEEKSTNEEKAQIIEGEF